MSLQNLVENNSYQLKIGKLEIINELCIASEKSLNFFCDTVEEYNISIRSDDFFSWRYVLSSDPAGGGRRIKIGYYNGNDKTMPFNNQCEINGFTGDITSQGNISLITGKGYRVNSIQVVGSQQGAITNPAVDLTQQNTSIIAILTAMRTHGLIAT